MNLEHVIQTITKRGFTDRQARFLVLVARHSGVCVMRQYSTFAGIVFGQKTRKFFANLVRARFVSTYDCAHSRGRVYHVRHRAIYEAIGEPDSRLRRPPGVPRALERLMLLDSILENPETLEVDLLCADVRVAIELDGGRHLADPVAYRRDRRKDRLLQENGYFVLRFLAEDVGKELDAVLDAILRVLARRRQSAATAEPLKFVRRSSE